MEHATARQLDRWLVQLHAVEQQALFQLRRARPAAGDEVLAADVDRHLRETERHRGAIAACLAQRNRRSSGIVDLAATLNRLGFLAYSALSPDTPIRLLVDSVAYEYFEIAAYRMLGRVAADSDAEAVKTTAARILADERTMAARLEESFDRAIAAVERQQPGRLHRRLLRHLHDAHALETQARALLGLGSRVAGSPALAACYREHAGETAGQRERIATRLRALGDAPSLVKSGVMRLAGTAWSGIWALQRDTGAKLACFSFAAIHLEIASYEVLRREATRAGDTETAELAAELLSEERAAAERLDRLLELAATTSLAGTPAGASA